MGKLGTVAKASMKLSPTICMCMCMFAIMSRTCNADWHQVRLMGYLFMFFTYWAVGLFFMYTAASSWYMKIFKSFVDCPLESEDACYGAQMIFRVAFALIIFYFIILLCMLPLDDFSYRVNKHGWGIKWALPLIFFIGLCFVPNAFFDIFSEVTKYMGVIYLIMQNLSYNEFFFVWTNAWLVKIQKNCCYTILYGVFSVGAFLGTLVFLILNFSWHWKSGCTGNKLFLILNVILLLVSYAVAAINMTNPKKYRGDVNYLGVTLYGLYTTYYFYSGMASDTNGSCSTIGVRKGFTLSEILINIVLIGIVIMFMVFLRRVPFIPDSAAEQSEEEKKFGIELKREVQLARAYKNSAQDEAGDKLEYRTFKYVWIFLCFVFLGTYFQNVVTNWGTVSMFDELYLYGNNQAGYWIKTLNGLFCGVFYIFVLCLPFFCDRDFGQEDRIRRERENRVFPPIGGGTSFGKSSDDGGKIESKDP